MTNDDLRRSANRDWQAVSASRLDYWADAHRQRGGAAAREASTALFLHARVVQPSYPSSEQRTADFAHYLVVCERLDRAARALTGR